MSPALSRNCERGAAGYQPLRRSSLGRQPAVLIREPGDRSEGHRPSHLRGSGGRPPAARYPSARWTIAAGRYAIAAGAELGATLAIAYLATASAAWVNLVPVAAFMGATLAVEGATSWAEPSAGRGARPR